MKKSNRHLYLPSIGIIVFIVLYLYAANLYPGGSKVEPQAIGFSWLHNYWCDLFDEVTKNGQKNPSRPIAIGAMLLLSASFSMLFYLLPRLFKQQNLRLKIMQISGILTMIIAAFIFTPFHGEVIHFGAVFGCIALVLLFIELFKAKLLTLFYFGIFCLILSLINIFIYDTSIGLFALALLQKVTFFFYCIWAILMNRAIVDKKDF